MSLKLFERVEIYTAKQLLVSMGEPSLVTTSWNDIWEKFLSSDADMAWALQSYKQHAAPVRSEALQSSSAMLKLTLR